MDELKQKSVEREQWERFHRETYQRMIAQGKRITPEQYWADLNERMPD